MRTRHAIMFRLSNKIVQVKFQDHTEIILSSETKVVTYMNKKGERQSYQLSTAMESSNMEMVKRLKYTKDILTHMLNSNANNGGTVPGGKDPTKGSTAAASTRPKTNSEKEVMGGAPSGFPASDRVGKGGFATHTDGFGNIE